MVCAIESNEDNKKYNHLKNRSRTSLEMSKFNICIFQAVVSFNINPQLIFNTAYYNTITTVQKWVNFIRFLISEASVNLFYVHY